MKKFAGFTRRHLGERVGRRLPVYLSSFIVWFATGIWHGVSWNFIVWGLCNWVVLMASEEMEPLYKKFHEHFLFGEMPVYRGFCVVRTFLLVCCLNMFDYYPSLSVVFRMFVSMFTVNNWQILWDGSLLLLGLTALDYQILTIGCLILVAVSLIARSGSVRVKILKLRYPVRYAIWYGLFLTVLLMGAYGIGYDASQFIYNRF